MAKINYHPADITSILYYAVIAMLNDLAEMGFGVVKTREEDSYRSYYDLLAYLINSRHRLAPVLMNSVKALWTGAGNLDRLERLNTGNIRVTGNQYQMEEGKYLYEALRTTPEYITMNEVARVQAFLDTFPYILYMLCRVPVYGGIDPRKAFVAERQRYNMSSGLRTLLQSRKPEVKILYELMCKIWTSSDEMTSVIVNY